MLPLLAAAVFVRTRSVGLSVWYVALYVMIPFMFLRVLLEQLAGRADDPNDPGQELSRSARGLLVAFFGMSLVTLLTMLMQGEDFGFGLLSVLVMGPVMGVVGFRGRAFGELGRGVGARRKRAGTSPTGAAEASGG